MALSHRSTHHLSYQRNHYRHHPLQLIGLFPAWQIHASLPAEKCRLAREATRSPFSQGILDVLKKQFTTVHIAQSRSCEATLTETVDDGGDCQVRKPWAYPHLRFENRVSVGCTNYRRLRARPTFSVCKCQKLDGHEQQAPCGFIAGLTHWLHIHVGVQKGMANLAHATTGCTITLGPKAAVAQRLSVGRRRHGLRGTDGW